MAEILTEHHRIPGGDPGITLYLRNRRRADLGSQGPARTLLFIHGATYPSSSTFDLELDGLSWMSFIADRGFDVWCLDLRGHGHSSRPPEMSRPSQENGPIARGDIAQRDIGAASAFIRKMRGLPRLTMMGHSWGTALVGRFSADNPGLVERVVLFAPVWIRRTPSLVQAGPGPLGAWRGVTREQCLARWTTGLKEDEREAFIPPGWFERFADVLFAGDPEGLAMNPPVVRAPNGVILDGLEYWSAGIPYYDPARIAAPTILVVGDRDVDTPPYMAKELYPLLPADRGSELALLGGGTHSMMMEMGRMRLFETVQDFLER